MFKMHSFFKRKLLIFLLSFLVLVIAEMTCYLIIFHVLYAEVFIMEFGAYLLLLAPCLLFKSNKGTIGYCSTVLGLVLFLFALNITLDYTSRDIFTFAYLSQAGEAAKVFDWDYLNWLALLIFFGFSGIYVGGLFLIYRKIVKEDDSLNLRYLPKAAILSLALLIVSSVGLTVSVSAVQKEYENNEIFEDMSGYQIIQYLSKYLKKTSMKKYGILNYSLATAQSTVATTTTQVDDSVMDEVNDTDPTVVDMTPVTDEYYGLLKDYNVIEIMIESGNEYLFDENLTPNLYKLASEGIYFTNNYSKNKTNVSEFIGINGATVPNIQYYEGELPYSLPNMLEEVGYSTSYFHNNYGEFYNRSGGMVTLGFDNISFSLDINPDHQWYNNYDGNYPLDSETIEDIMENLAPKDSETPYYSFWTSLSMHGPYIGQKNWQKFIELGYVDRLKNAEALGLWENPCLGDSDEVISQIEMVMCETMDFDAAIGKLLDYLEETNQSENTLLVLYGDHETYFSVGIDRPLKEYVYDCDNETYPGQYQTMMFMYNPTLTAKYKEVEKLSPSDIAYYNDFTSPYIIVPSLLELLGVNYNPEVYTGVSIFQTSSAFDNLFYSHELGSLFTDKVYTIDVSNEFLYVEPGTSDEYLEKFQIRVTALLEKINKIEQMYATGSYKEE